jgi:hypothetical protein
MKRAFSSLWLYVSAAIIALGVSAAMAGVAGLQGMALGLVGTGVVIGGTAGVVTLITRAAKDKKTPWWGAAAILVVFLAMLPAYILAALQVQRAGGPGPSFFLAGMLLVYCLLIGWAQATR